MTLFAKPDPKLFADSARLIRDVQHAEHQWFKQGDPKSPYNPWMPFQPADFLAILFDCVGELRGNVFLDVGCGPGTKMALAAHFYGLEAWGIEIDPDMAQAAGQYGTVVCADALNSAPGAYAFYDLIWLYRPLRDVTLEWQLEQRIISEMKPGAILAGASWETDPASLHWVTVFDDYLTDPRTGALVASRGAWMKPGG